MDSVKARVHLTTPVRDRTAALLDRFICSRPSPHVRVRARDRIISTSRSNSGSFYFGLFLRPIGRRTFARSFIARIVSSSLRTQHPNVSTVLNCCCPVRLQTKTLSALLLPQATDTRVCLLFALVSSASLFWFGPRTCAALISIYFAPKLMAKYRSIVSIVLLRFSSKSY